MTIIRAAVRYLVLLSAISSIPVAHDRALAQSTAPAARIGTIDGAAHEVFGRIVDIAVDDAGNVFILDQLNQHVGWFDAQGKHRASIGRSGRGPGEFNNPVSIAVSRGQVYVLDTGNNRLSSFNYTGDEVRHDADLRVPGRPSDFCALEDRLFLLSYHADRLIHEVDRQGGIIRSFGQPEDPEAIGRTGAGAELLRQTLNRGKLACDAEQGLIVLMHEQLPVVSAFRSTGQRLWQVVLNPYHMPEWLPAQRSDGFRTRIDPKLKRANSSVSLAIGDDSSIYLTLSEVSVNAQEGVTIRLEHRKLNSRDGRLMERRPGAVRIADVRAERTYGYADDPFPHVAIEQRR